MKCIDGCGLEKPAMSFFGDVGAVFIGVMLTEKTDFKFRLYNITGNHPSVGSTVTVDTLVQNNIPITDMTEEEIETELRGIHEYMGSDI